MSEAIPVNMNWYQSTIKESDPYSLSQMFVISLLKTFLKRWKRETVKDAFWINQSTNQKLFDSIAVIWFKSHCKTLGSQIVEWSQKQSGYVAA